MSLPLFVRAARAANVERVAGSAFSRRCEQGLLRRIDVLRLLAFQAEASRGFMPFLEALVARSGQGPVQDALRANLAEETADDPCPHAQWARMTRVALFERLGASAVESRAVANDVAPMADRYLARLEELLSPRLSSVEAAAAFALAVEDAVPTIYAALVRGLTAFPSVRTEDVAFFEAHVACDVDHALRILVACREEARQGADLLRWRPTLACASSILTNRVRALDAILALEDAFSQAPAVGSTTPHLDAGSQRS
jgi:hypothetical protein